MPDLTVAELARHLGVHRSTVASGIRRGRRAHEQDPTAPAPPDPVNPGEPQLRYPLDQIGKWWPRRPDGRGRPRARQEAS
jgi:transposase-like protein